MIFFDVTKSASAKHQSGLLRVSARLRQEFGANCVPVRWEKEALLDSAGKRVAPTRLDWLITPELFSESERPGWWAFLRNPPCRICAIFHDAIPLKWPHTTWPQSVARHPEYMKMLASFDRVFAVSEASRTELRDFWRWQGVSPRSEPGVLALGSDFAGQPRAITPAAGSSPLLFLCVGILEPRKNQEFLLDVAAELLSRGIEFRLEFVGRVNPHFGKRIEKRLRAFSRAHPNVRYRENLPDAALLEKWRGCAATLFPTLAEGCGLPLLESLWLGVPCVASDLPVLRENASAGGCRLVAANEVKPWADELERLVKAPGAILQLQTEARSRPLPTWKGTVAVLTDELGAG